MKRKMAMVLMTLVMAVSLVFGMTTIAQASTEIAWPETFTSSAWSGATELRLPTNYSDFNGGNLNPTAENLGKVRITRGETVYKASDVYGWENKLTFYFNGSGYNGQAAQRGDILTVDAGFTISKNGNEYTSTTEKKYIFTGGTKWIAGSELPAETEIDFPETISVSAWNSDTEVRIPTGFAVKNTTNLNPTAEALALVKITRGDTEYKASHVYEWNGCLTFYFNQSGYTGKTAQRGDLLTVGAGFTVNHNGVTYVCAEGKNYIFTGAEWISGTELPQEAEAFVLGDVSTTSGSQIEIASTQLLTGGDEADLTVNAATNISMTAADGEVYTPSHIRQIVSRKTFKLYFLNANGNNKKYSFDSAAIGDLLTIKKGFAIKGNFNLEAKEDINYIYTGSSWIKGAELPTEAEELVLGDVSAFYIKGTQIEIGCTMFSGKDEIDLTVENADKIVLTDTTGKTYASSHRRQIPSRKAFKLYFNNTGYSFDSAQRGDKLVIGAGFAIKGDYNYVVKSDITYLYTGTCWVKATELPAEKTELKVNSITAGVGVSGENRGDALVYVNTDSSSDVNNGNADVAELRNFVRYTFAGEKVAYGNVWYARLNKAEARFFVRQKDNAALNMAVSDIAKGDKFTVKKGFSIGNAEVKADVTYIYNGNIWVDEADYVDYSKFTKTGIVADETEITLYKGDKFVVPALHYTYKEEVKVPELVEEEVTVENAPDMNTVNENGYDVTLKAGGFSLTLKVKVLATTDISVSNVLVDTGWNKIQVVTTTANADNNTNAQKEYLEYFSYMRDGVELTIDSYVVLTKNYGLDVSVNGEKLVFGGVSAVKVGDTLTIKKGLPGINGERLAETVTYVYNGSRFVVLVEPETFSLAETSATVFINVTKKIVVKDDDNVTAVYSYVSDHPEIATVSPYGVITGVKEGTAKITVSYKNLAKELTVTVKPEPAKTGIEIVTDITKFYVPVSTTEAPTSFVKAGYTLKARYVYEGGEYGGEFDVTEDQIGEIDYTTAGNYDLTVTVGEFTADVNVEVYNYREVTSFNTLGVSGYDINDDRNASGTWNGHMIISMSSVSTSAGNLLSTASCETMSEYIVYTTADGKTYYGKGDKDNGIDDRIGLWQLGTNLLIMIKPEGATANLGYGSEDHWKKDAQHPYVPIYKLGDKITFKKGMPIYAWKGALDGSNKPLEGAGCLIVEGIVTEDIVYFCYEDNGTSSLWMIYKEYTDFTVTAEKTMSLGTASPAGAVKVPADATTGTFAYVSDHPEIVSVTKDGNMLAEKVGTATITITLTGGKDADGNDLAPIVKTIKVTVKNGIKSISGKITVQKDAQVNLGDYEITVKYSDGSEVKVKLDDERVVVEDIDASTVGTTTANILFNDGTEQKRGTITVEVVEKTAPADSGNSGKKGCGGSLGGLGILGGLAVAAAVVINKKKRDN